MKHNGTINDKDKSKREYKKINTIKIKNNLLLNKAENLPSYINQY
jgi:hypothetical protein